MSQNGLSPMSPNGLLSQNYSIAPRIPPGQVCGVWSVVWLFGWLVGWLVVWLAGWLVGWLVVGCCCLVLSVSQARGGASEAQNGSQRLQGDPGPPVDWVSGGCLRPPHPGGLGLEVILGLPTPGLALPPKIHPVELTRADSQQCISSCAAAQFRHRAWV